jgi:hypothetical protein
MWSAIAKAKKNIPLGNVTLLEDSVITITRGVKEKYALWTNEGTFDLPAGYVDEASIKSMNMDNN